jgi:maltooligosyltrehalose trehalohydrolase
MVVPWRLERGASVLESGAVRFAVWAPHVERMSVRIEDGETVGETPLARDDANVFSAIVSDVPPGARYWYRLDGNHDRPDPVSRSQPAGVHGPSAIVDPDAFCWTDDSWTGPATDTPVYYELHVGTFTEPGTFEAVVERLPYLTDLGVTVIELMPVAAFPGERNWGYDGVCPYAPASCYGGPAGLQRLVDAAHAAGLAVVLDVVYNHLGPEGNYLTDFGPYFTERYHTPWGAAVNFDGEESDEVRRYVIDNALHWITDYHIDGLRLDAVHAIFDFSAFHILEELAAAVHAQAGRLGRRVIVVAESDLNDPRLIRERGRGGYGLDAQWNDDFHHAVHAALTGERQGYYEDFGGVEPIAKALRDRFVYDGRWSAYRKRRHGAAAADLPPRRLVAFVQNHDQVGNRAQGDRLSTLVSLDAQKLAAAVLLLSPFVPLLFMGEEFGETNPFLYFIDHGDPELVEAVREGRAREFARFRWSGPIPDPKAPDTFHRSRVRHDRARRPPHAQLLALHRDLIRIRRAEPALQPGAAIRLVRPAHAQWLAVFYDRPGAAGCLAIFNFAGEPSDVTLETDRRWAVQLATNEPRYAGGGAPVAPPPGRAKSWCLGVPAWTAALLRSEAP